MVQAEVRDAWGKTSARWEELMRFRESILPRAEQSLRSDLTAFETNGVDFLSLLESFRMLQMLKMEEAMLVGEYIANVAQLERAVGRDLQ
jgi:outer membrane protein TolC